MYHARASKRHDIAHTYSSRPSKMSRSGHRLKDAIRHVDIDTGLVYSESKVAVSKRQSHDWIAELRQPGSSRRREPNLGRGSRTLFETATHSLSENMRSIGPNHLFEVPWTIGEKVWTDLLSSRRESFHAWRTFASVFAEEFSSPSMRYQLSIRELALPLVEYFQGLSCSPPRWHVALRLSPRYTSMPDLVNVSLIRNLAVLDLSDDFTIDAPLGHFNERIMKSWAELAAVLKAFRHLRVLMLGWQEHAAAWIFKHLKSFPSLSAVIFTDCPRLHQRNRNEWEDEARSYGWVARPAKRSTKSLRPIVGDAGFHVGAVSGAYYETQERYNRIIHDFKPIGTEESLPLVECWIGRPRLWTHIVDEFPGTRTVWFDNSNTAEEMPSTTAPAPGKETSVQVARGGPPTKHTADRPIRQRNSKQGGKTLERFLAEFNQG